MQKEKIINFPTLETERVVLRKMTSKDDEVVFDFNSCDESLKYIIREPFKTKDEAKEKLDAFLNGIEDKSAIWWVFTLKETGKDIGYGGLFDISEVHSRAEVGYGLIKEYWNKGYMSEIVEAIVDFGVSMAQFHKIYGVIIDGNLASVKLLEKNNFKKEAHLKGHSIKGGIYYDETIYSLISDKL